jgi:hypothetical protein
MVLLPLHVPTPALMNQVFAVPVCEVKVFGTVLLEFSIETAGPFNTLAGSDTAPGATMEGRFVRCALGGAMITVTRIKMKELP